MLWRLSGLDDPPNDSFTVLCGAVHAYVALFFFLVFDAAAVALTGYIYWSHATFSTEWHSIAPLVALCFSLSVYMFGPIGLVLDHVCSLTIYRLRLLLILIWSFVWSCVVLFFQTQSSRVVIAMIWFGAALVYLYGVMVANKATRYIRQKYNGYDDGDPEKMAAVERGERAADGEDDDQDEEYV